MIDVKVVDSTPAQDPELSTIITDGNILEIADNESATITTTIDGKFPTAVGKYTLSAITGTTALATGKSGYQGTVDITFTVKVTTPKKVAIPAPKKVAIPAAKKVVSNKK